MRGYGINKDDHLKMLTRLEGMFLTQVNAGRQRRRVSLGLLDEHVRDCVRGPRKGGVMPALRKYPPELRERAIRFVPEARDGRPELSLNGAVR